jgi:hypothetical protein
LQATVQAGSEDACNIPAALTTQPPLEGDHMATSQSQSVIRHASSALSALAVLAFVTTVLLIAP